MSIFKTLNDNKAPQKNDKGHRTKLKPVTQNFIDNYSFHGDLGKGISGQIFRVKNKLTYQMKALKIVQLSDPDVNERIQQRLQQLSYFTDYKQICSINQHNVKDYTKHKAKQIKNINQIHIFILMELCQYNLKWEIKQRSLGSKKLYFSQQELLNILIPNLILLTELEKNDVHHENLKTSKFLKGYDGIFKLCGTVTGAPILDQLVDYQASKSKKKDEESTPVLGPQQILEDKYKQSYPYFSPERMEVWGEAKKLPKHDKAKSEVFSLGLVILEAGNLLDNVSGLNHDHKQMQEELDEFSENYPTIEPILQQMLVGQKDLEHRPKFEDLLKLIQDNGLMYQRLSQFKRCQVLYKFHNIDQKIVNKLQESLEYKDREIEKLQCKLQTLREEAKQPDDQIQEGKEYQFTHEQIGPLLEFLQDTKFENDKYVKINLDFSYYEDTQKQLIKIGNALKNHKYIRSLCIDMECFENDEETGTAESEPTALYSYFQTLKNLRVIRFNFDGAKFTDQHLHVFGRQIQYLFRLEELYLNFNETVIEGDEGLCMLSEGLSEMGQLQRFHLKMDFTQITDFGFNHVAKSISNKKDLIEVVLSFIQTNIETNTGLRLLGRSIKDMHKLEILDLAFNKTKVDQKGFKLLVANLKEKKCLNTLKLNFGKTNIKDDTALCELAESLKGLSNLKAFSLEFVETKAGDKFFQALLEPLSRLSSLRELSLGFGKTPLKDENSILKLAQVLEQLQKLKKLSVVLYKTELKDQGISVLCESLQHLRDIEFLLLSFGKTQLMTDDSMLKLSQSIVQFKCLKHFELYVQQTMITGKAFHDIIYYVTKHVELEHLSLNFSETAITSDAGLNQLGNTLDRMKNLHTFELYLAGDIGISIQSVRMVVQGIKNNENIKTIKCKIKSTKLKENKLKEVKQLLGEIVKQRQSIL